MPDTMLAVVKAEAAPGAEIREVKIPAYGPTDVLVPVGHGDDAALEGHREILCRQLELLELVLQGAHPGPVGQARELRAAIDQSRHAVVAGVDNTMGALLAQIEPDSPAAKAGLLPGDVVIKLDGVEINGVDDLIRVLDRDRIGRTLPMDVLRLGRLRAIDIHPVERKPAARAALVP